MNFPIMFSGFGTGSGLLASTCMLLVVDNLVNDEILRSPAQRAPRLLESDMPEALDNIIPLSVCIYSG